MPTVMSVLSVPSVLILLTVPLAMHGAAQAAAQTAAQSADPAAGKTRSSQCAACHGANGIATMPDAPNLAGQNETYLVKAMKDYRSGARRHEQMSVMAKGLSDKDIESLAAYYHRLPAGGEGSGAR